MKKAKIVLSALAVFAVIGGGFAFKAKRESLFYFTKANPTAPCLWVGNVGIVPNAPLVPNVYTTQVTTTTSLPSNFCTQTLRIGLEI